MPYTVTSLSPLLPYILGKRFIPLYKHSKMSITNSFIQENSIINSFIKIWMDGDQQFGFRRKKIIIYWKIIPNLFLKLYRRFSLNILKLNFRTGYILLSTTQKHDQYNSHRQSDVLSNRYDPFLNRLIDLSSTETGSSETYVARENLD